jgi:hypothetical protein
MQTGQPEEGSNAGMQLLALRWRPGLTAVATSVFHDRSNRLQFCWDRKQLRSVLPEATDELLIVSQEFLQISEAGKRRAQ